MEHSQPRRAVGSVDTMRRAQQYAEQVSAELRAAREGKKYTLLAIGGYLSQPAYWNTSKGTAIGRIVKCESSDAYVQWLFNGEFERAALLADHMSCYADALGLGDAFRARTNATLGVISESFVLTPTQVVPFVDSVPLAEDIDDAYRVLQRQIRAIRASHPTEILPLSEHVDSLFRRLFDSR